MPSRYVPIFPPPDTSQDLLAPSIYGSQALDETQEVSPTLTERLSRAYNLLASLPEELAPNSCPPSPHTQSKSEERIDQLRETILDAVTNANAEPANPKWTHVTRLVQMASTSRGYVGCAPGVRMGDMTPVEAEGFDCAFPATEQEWSECEKKWEKCNKRKGKGREEPRSSKYFADKHSVSNQKAISVRQKVEIWQAKLVIEETQSQQSRNPNADVRAGVGSAHGDLGSQAKGASTSKRQSPLSFPVVKHAANHGSKPAPRYPSSSPIDANAEAPRTAEPPIVKQVDRSSLEPGAAQKAPGISDVSEMSYVPPSFPSHLQTSTPLDQPKPKSPNQREKPPPIYPQIFLPSSPVSLPFTHSSDFNPAHPQRTERQPPVELSSPHRSPRRVQKRARPLTPPDGDEDDPSIARPQATTSPLRKKARPDEERPAELEPVSSAPAPPPSTPPLPMTPPTSRLKSPLPLPRSHSKDLGNAKGLPVPTTPERKQLPTLTELLASSRRSKPRPRPPSRKSRSNTTTPQRPTRDDPAVPESDKPALPALYEDPEPSPAKTYFSSPASGSSSSSQSSPRSPLLHRQQRHGSPTSPLLPGGKLRRFAPQFTSTQQQPGGPASAFPDAGATQTQTGLLPPTGSGFFGMGYSSQFDVDGQVDRVSELLERDVDFSGWIKDIPDLEDGEGRDTIEA
ncbi:hypothetical protein K474DRAFT_1773814 [Panus rudis PR-1116 ss-1]|nr:hypothetical protein K474DRAFT_1773814 [Panus rudis PR-1116 ss-1]